MYFGELEKGMSMKLAPVTISKEEMLAFSGKYADVPVHTDEEYAKTTSFGQLLAPGMLSFLKVWAEYLKNDLFGEQLLAGRSQSIEWYKPVFAGDVLTATVTVTELTDRSPKNGIAELTIEAFNGKGELVLKGVTEAIIKKKLT